MKIKYFADTDTALIEFSENRVMETRELNENIYLDLDHSGRVVSLTIEHARQSANMNEFSFQQMRTPVPAQ
ncbi:MAG TPA: DUF2283 domain-containing protein [bacterium]|nr:DUF2283 domain-containing protein [bacterium]HPR89665.1 DUF2283 domain-containing protein [bacterium]